MLINEVTAHDRFFNTLIGYDKPDMYINMAKKIMDFKGSVQIVSTIKQELTSLGFEDNIGTFGQNNYSLPNKEISVTFETQRFDNNIGIDIELMLTVRSNSKYLFNITATTIDKKIDVLLSDGSRTIIKCE